MIKREIQKLEKDVFDILIIGAGVSGAAIAWDSALRGLKVALIEKNDFGHATSSATSKLIHGGLRYLKNFEFKVVRESLRERRYLLENIPHLAFPLPFLIPVYKNSSTPKWLLKIGLTVYDFLSYDRNFLKDSSKKIPRHKWYSREDALAMEPGLNSEQLLGAYCYYDVQDIFPERANMEYILSAGNQGAVIANYMEAEDFIYDSSKKKVSGVIARDLISNKTISINARVTVNATGPWGDVLLKKITPRPARTLVHSKGIHLIVPRIQKDRAITIETRTGEHIFILPWLNYTLLGTTDSAYNGPLDHIQVSKKEALEFLEAVNSCYPIDLKKIKILHAYAGVRPLVSASKTQVKTYNLSRKEEAFNHLKKEKISGLYSVFGGKWTTSRALAEKTVNDIIKTYSFKRAPCNTTTTPLSGESSTLLFYDFATKQISKYKNKIPGELLNHWIQYYGMHLDNVIKIYLSDPSMQKIVPGYNMISTADIIYSIRYEMALKLEDFLMRRSIAGNIGMPDKKSLEFIASVMSKELKWNKKDKESMITKYIKNHSLQK